jgi:hypothetical protein
MDLTNGACLASASKNKKRGQMDREVIEIEGDTMGLPPEDALPTPAKSLFKLHE